MPRNALKVFFERVILSALPVVAASACHKVPVPSGGGYADLATGVGGGGGSGGSGGGGGGGGGSGGGGSGGSGGGGGSQDMAFNGTPKDMALVHKDLDSCETTALNTPEIVVVFPASVIPDGGLFRNGANLKYFPVVCAGDMGGCVCIDHCPAPYNTCASHNQPVDMAGGAAGPPGYLVTCVFQCGIGGRRPEGLEAAQPTGGCAAGHYFATQAHLEAASVHAFRVMARELAAHGAPSRLIAAAKRAAGDEIRHARVTRRFALAHGARPAPVKVARPLPRSLEAIAQENASEGCVRETFAALLASWQARTAADPEVREMMTGIASDETRHAQLAWDLAAWLDTKLDRAARRRIKETTLRTADALADEMSQPVPPELVHALGLPTPDRAREFVAAARHELWS